MQIDLLLVNPPILQERPNTMNDIGTLFIPGDIKVEAMNPGLLSICSYLKKKGYRVEICDLLLSEDFFLLEDAIETFSPKVVGISSSCAFDYLAALKCVEISKKVSPSSTVVIGGQQAGPIRELVFDESPFLDCLCLYEGETFLEMLIEKIRHGLPISGLSGSITKVNGTLIVNDSYPDPVPLDDLPLLDFKAYPNYRYFTPFIEESRGCSFGCEFCTSNIFNKRNIRIKSPERISRDIDNVKNHFEGEKTVAILASSFGMRADYARDTVALFNANNIRYTTEIRVDSPWETYIDEALSGGLTVLNVGVESFSKEILLIMNKTNNPERYLHSAAKLSNIFKYQSNSILRTNMILYVGESPSTIRESLSFLSKYGGGIESMLCSTVFAVNGTKLHRNFKDYERKYGCELMTDPYWDKVHVFPCKLSKYFSFNETCALAKVIEKMYSTEEGWYQAEMCHYSQLDTQTVKNRKEILISSRFSG